MSRVVLAMSGGVDSSVAAHLLQRAGHEVIGVFMRHGEPVPEAAAAGTSLPIVSLADRHHKQGCCSAEDAADARRVADRLDIPFYALNLQAEFGRIMDYFVDEYLRGRTPNPCVVCNHWLKFGKLFEYADSVDARVCGHRTLRAVVWRPTMVPRPCAAASTWTRTNRTCCSASTAGRLRRMLLPVGDYRKPEIRALAAELGLRVAEKRDSQEICFVPPGQHGEFVRLRRGQRDTSGRIVTTDGQVVGHHPGIERFTIGQRKGLGVAMGEPYFVVRIDPDSHDVVIGRPIGAGPPGTDGQRDELAGLATAERFRCQAKIRYNTPPAAAWATALADGRLDVEFDEPCYGVAAGQAVVCYDGDRVLGGGWIE